MISNWIRDWGNSLASWAWVVPSTSHTLSASCLDFAEVVMDTLRCFEGYFIPDYVSLYWRRAREFDRDSVLKNKWGGRRFEWIEGFADTHGGSKLKKTPGFMPEEIGHAVLEVAKRNRSSPPVTELYVYGISNVFDVDSTGRLTEIWERRDSAPNNSDGTLNFQFANPFPHHFNVRIWTKSTIFVSDIDESSNKEIAHRNKKKLERYLRKFEQDLNAKNRYSVSEYYQDFVWKHGFK